MVKLFDDFFAFMRYCLGYKRNISNVVAGMDWQKLYSFASKQAILGLCFDGIERLGKEYPDELRLNPIGRELLMTWMGKAQQIRRQNRKVNLVASKLFSMLREDGMRCCILKGQGNALMMDFENSTFMRLTTFRNLLVLLYWHG